jgi:hypothetical protein
MSNPILLTAPYISHGKFDFLDHTSCQSIMSILSCLTTLLVSHVKFDFIDHTNCHYVKKFFFWAALNVSHVKIDFIDCAACRLVKCYFLVNTHVKFDFLKWILTTPYVRTCLIRLSFPRHLTFSLKKCFLGLQPTANEFVSSDFLLNACTGRDRPKLWKVALSCIPSRDTFSTENIKQLRLLCTFVWSEELNEPN